MKFNKFDEILKYLIIIVLGYVIASFFYKKNNCFKIGGQNTKPCEEYENKLVCNTKILKCKWDDVDDKCVSKSTNIEKYSCSGSKCISDTSGSYITTNCDNMCGFSCNASNICEPGSSGSDTYDTIDICENNCGNSGNNIWKRILYIGIGAVIGGIIWILFGGIIGIGKISGIGIFICASLGAIFGNYIYINLFI